MSRGTAVYVGRKAKGLDSRYLDRIQFARTTGDAMSDALRLLAGACREHRVNPVGVIVSAVARLNEEMGEDNE